MQDEHTKQEMDQCVVCGKPVPKRDTRTKKPAYCGRVHAGLARFATRYRGSNSGPLDRPRDLLGKTKFES